MIVNTPKENPLKVIMVAGDFGKGVEDRLHPGHRDHIQKAATLGDFLIIVTHRDEEIVARKGYQPDKLEVRMARLTEELRLTGKPGAVILAKDTDGTVTRTLKEYHPDIFAKGGGYTRDTMPHCEIDECERLGIEIRYGVGERLGQSRDIARVVEELAGRK